MAASKVVSGEITARMFHELQQVVGVNYNKLGMIFDPVLREHGLSMDSARFDWMHSMMADGTFSTELERFMATFAHHGASRAEIARYVSHDSWRTPSQAVPWSNVVRVFDLHRVSATEPEKFKGTCGEMLSLFVVVQHFVKVYVHDAPDLQPQRASFEAVCRVLNLILETKHETVRVAQAVPLLEDAISEHLRLHKLAYGTEHIRPKHHWMFDIPKQVKTDNCVLDAFVVERRHLRVKAAATPVLNTEVYNKSCMSNLLTAALHHLCKDECFPPDGLIGTMAPLADDAHVVVSDKMRGFSMLVSVGDMVMRGECGGCVVACAMDRGSLFAIVTVCEPIRNVPGHWRDAGRVEVWDAERLSFCFAWRSVADDIFEIIRA